MSEPITSREAIAKDAEVAAQRAAATGLAQTNPWPTHSEAWGVWHREYCRLLLKYSAAQGAEA